MLFKPNILISTRLPSITFLTVYTPFYIYTINSFPPPGYDRWSQPTMDHVQRLDHISLDHMYSVRYGEDDHSCAKTSALPSSTPQGIYLKWCTRSKYQAVMRSLPYGGQPQSHLVHTLDLMSSPMTGGNPHLPACRRWIADGVEDGQVIPDERRTGWKQMVHQFQLPACWGVREVNSLQSFCKNFVRETLRVKFHAFNLALY